MKITVIGGGGKISSAVIYEMLSDVRDVPLEFALYGRNGAKTDNTLKISKRFAGNNARVYRQEKLEDALYGAEIVFFCATNGTLDCGGYRSMGITNGAFIMQIGELITKICPDAWFAVVTNPPDIPLSAVKKRFGLSKLIALCNAPVFNEKMTASFLGCAESDLDMYEFGVNHEYWFYDIKKNGVSVYDELRSRLPAEYSVQTVRSESLPYLREFHADFPEWSVGFQNNAKLLGLCGYLSGPVGGSNRYKGLPVALKDMWAVSSRPTAEDFEKLTDESLSLGEIRKRAGRCAAGLPRYVAEVLESVVYDDGKERHVIALNGSAAPEYPENVMLQTRCRIYRDRLVLPDLGGVPEYVRGVMSSRIFQNDLMSDALAFGDDEKLRQAILCYPERIECAELEGFLESHGSVEPFAQLD